MERFQEAEPMLLESYRFLYEHQGANSLHSLAALERLIRFYTANGDPAAANRFRKLGEGDTR